MSEEKQFGMLIDLSTCIGCNACAVACKQENDVPLGSFNTWVESWDVTVDGRVRRANMPKLCNHCEDAPCVKVCPTGASFKTDEGVVLVDADKCIGCKYCMAACPYTSNGLMPACVSTCVTRSRYFGDLNDPESDISKKIAELGSEGLYADLGLKPSVTYVGLSETLDAPVMSAIHHGGNVAKKFEG